MALSRQVRWVGICVTLLALAGPAAAADMRPTSEVPAKPPAAPAPHSPLAAPNATCQEWTDGCRICKRQTDSTIACSNISIACEPKDLKCTR